MKRKKKRKRAPRAAAAPPPASPRLPWLAFALAPLCAFFAYRSVSSFELVGDARFLILDNRFAHSLAQLVPTLGHDYLWSSSGNIIPYWRPVTKLSWLFEWQLFHDWAGGYAWVNVGWHAFGALGVSLLGLRLGLSRALACVCAVVYALHPVTIEAVSLVMARSDVVAASATVWAVVGWLGFRAGQREGRKSWGSLALHVVMTVLALGSKEAALVLPAVLLGMAALAGDFARPARARLGSLAPAVALALAYFVARKLILERQAAGLSATTLAFDPLRIVACLGFYLRETFPLALRSGLRDLPIAEAKSAAFVAKTLLTLAALGALVIFAWRRNERTLLGLIVWTLLALLPVLLPKDIAVVTEATKFPLADRWLHHALAPALVAWVMLAKRATEALGQRFAALAPRLGAASGALLGVWALTLLLRSNGDRAELSSDLAMLDNEDRVFYRAIPQEYRSAWDDCRHDERMLAKASLQKQPERLLELAPAAVARCASPELDLYYLEALFQLRRYEEAEPVARRLIARPPRDVRGHGRVAALAGLTLLERGHTLEARPLVESAVRLGALSCTAFVSLAEAARRQGRLVEAAAHAETAHACGGRRDPSLLIAAATWLTAAGERERARGLLERTRGLAQSPDQRAQVEALEKELAGAAPIGTRP